MCLFEYLFPLVLPIHTSYPLFTSVDANDTLPPVINESDDCNKPCNSNTTGAFDIVSVLLSTFEHLCKPY